MSDGKRQQPIGILIDGGGGHLISGNKIRGEMDAIVSRDSYNNTIINNDIHQGDDSEKYNEIQSLLNNHLATLSQHERLELNTSFNGMKQTARTPGFLSYYQSFTSILSNHITILTAVAPFTPWLLSLIYR